MVCILVERRCVIELWPFMCHARVLFSIWACALQDRLRVVPFFLRDSRASETRARVKSLHARKARRGGEKEKWGTTWNTWQIDIKHLTDCYWRTNQSFGLWEQRISSKAWALSMVPHFSLFPPRLAFFAWGDFHARSRFARSTIREEKFGTLVA